MGGKELPCISYASLAVLQAETKGEQLCPRVELLPENEGAAALALLAIRTGSESALWVKTFDLFNADLDSQAALDVLYRVLNAVSDEGVAGRLQRERDRQRAEQEKPGG